jgi:hypothetical protein
VPRIALCALNPHAGDGGRFGREDDDLLAPVARACGMFGPFPADTVFVRALRGEFDAVIAPYHDVGMTAIKVASFGSGRGPRASACVEARATENAQRSTPRRSAAPRGSPDDAAMRMSPSLPQPAMHAGAAPRGASCGVIPPKASDAVPSEQNASSCQIPSMSASNTSRSGVPSAFA